MKNEIPCKECITLAICSSLVVNQASISPILSYKCNLFGQYQESMFLGKISFYDDYIYSINKIFGKWNHFKGYREKLNE